MKYLKYILLSLLFIFTACGDKLSPQEKELVKNMRRNNELRQKQKEEEIKNRWKGFRVEIIDSCEYLIREQRFYNGGLSYMAHKGNCKFCKERRNKELKEYEQRQYEQFTRNSKDSL